MRSLSQILESLIKSYNERERVSFFDVRDLDSNLGSCSIVDSIISSYNESLPPNFTSLRDLQKMVES